MDINSRRKTVDLLKKSGIEVEEVVKKFHQKNWKLSAAAVYTWLDESKIPGKKNSERLKAVLADHPISVGAGAVEGTPGGASTTGKEDDVTELYRLINRLRDRVDELEEVVYRGQEKKRFKSGTH